MAEKESPDNSHYEPDEKGAAYTDEKGSAYRRVSLAEATERRQSVALNVVENPLTVS